MKLRRIAQNLVWAEHPKAGMFFAMTVVSFLLCVVAPALSYVAFAAPPIGKTAEMNWAPIRTFTDDQDIRAILLLLLLFLYVALLTWRYYISLLRTVFASKSRYAVPIGFVATVAPALGLFGVVLPCAIKARVRKALLAFAAMTVCMILAIAAVHSDALRPELVVALCLLSGLFYVAVLIHLPPGRVGWWAYAPAVMPIMLVAVLAAADANLHKQIQKLEADFYQHSRLSMTVDEFKAELKSGISKEELPYDILFSELIKLHDVPKINAHGVDGGPTEEQQAQFEAFAATNAELLAKVDVITGQRNLNYSDTITWNQLAKFSDDNWVTLASYIRLVNWYLAKGQHAALHSDEATAVDSFNRIDNISTWLAHDVSTSSQLTCLAIENIKLRCIEAAVPVLSDVEIAAQQKRIQVNPRDFIERWRMNRIASYIMFEEATNAITEQGAFVRHERAARKLCLPFVRFYVKLEQRCALRYVIHELQLFDGDARSESQLYARLEGDEHEWWGHKNVRMPMSREFLFSTPGFNFFAETSDTHRAAEIGLAVEQYRRRCGTLPEELSALVPDFLESLPLSNATGKPFEYQRGDFHIPLLRSGETRRVIGYRVFCRYSERPTRRDPDFVVWLGNATTDGSIEGQDAESGVQEQENGKRYVALASAVRERYFGQFIKSNFQKEHEPNGN